MEGIRKIRPRTVPLQGLRHQNRIGEVNVVETKQLDQRVANILSRETISVSQHP